MHTAADDAVLARQRHEELEAEVEQAEGEAREAGDPTQTILVQVVLVSGLPFPSSAHAVYPAMKVDLTVASEILGAAVSVATTGDWFPVAHIGPQAPTVGDILLATRVGEVWVTRKVLA